MKIEMPYVELVLIIEKALRDRVVVWNDEEYREIADFIARRLFDGQSKSS